MEVVGAIASFSQLLSNIVAVSKVIVELYDDFKTAPRELQRLRERIDIIRLQLNDIQHLCNVVRGDAEILSDDFLDLSRKTLSGVWQAISAVQGISLYKSSGLTIRKRTQWACIAKSQVQKALRHLEITEQRLGFLLHLLQIRISISTRSALISICNADGKISTDLERRRVENQKGVHRLVENTRNGDSPKGGGRRRIYLGMTASHPCFLQQYSWLEMFGFRGVIARYKNGRDVVLLTSFSVGLFEPLLHKSLSVEVAVRPLPSCRTGFSLLWGQFSIRNIVPYNSEAMTACRHGDLIKLRDQIENGLAMPNDMTKSGQTMLQGAIESGNRTVTQYLIENGADASSIIDSVQVTPLRLAFKRYDIEMCRLLVEYGDVDEMDIFGRTLATTLWHPGKPPRSRIEFIQFLTGFSFSDFSAPDQAGWTALHHAAASGTAEDIAALITYGADVYATLPRVLLHPLHVATSWNNISTVSEILTNHAPDQINTSDFQGFTPLHKAANGGNTEMINLLLKHGADIDALSEPSCSPLVPASLHNEKFTPHQLAKATGPEELNAYNAALTASGRQIVSDDNEELYWDAQGSPSFPLK